MPSSIYLNFDAPDTNTPPPRLDDEPQKTPPAARHPPPPRGRRLVMRGALVTLAFLLVFSGLAMLVVGHVGYSPRLLIGMALTYVVMVTIA